jgi:hypothetical protein
VITPGSVVKGCGRDDRQLSLIIAAARHSTWPPLASYRADMLCVLPQPDRLLRNDTIWDDAWIVISV